MQAVTLAIALAGSLAVFLLKPIRGFCLYLILLFGYPQALTVPLGLADFSVSRIVILAVLANAVLRGKLLRHFKWCWMDTWAMATFLLTCISLTQNAPMMKVLEREAGRFFDIMLPYFAVRLVLRDRADLVMMIKTLALIGIPLAFMGAYQAVTGVNPVGFLRNYYAWGLARDLGQGGEMRYGFYRAAVTMDIHIIFGLFFAMVAPLTLGLWRQANWSTARIAGTFCILLLGLMSSVSSGPLFSIVVTFGFLAFYPLRRYWPAFAICMLGSCIFVEVFSNRHFYEVFDRFAFSSRNAYYRVGLINEAFGGGMDDHWIFGYGYVGIGPGNDNSNFFWYYKDFVNIYIGRLARFGLVGLIPYLILNTLYFLRLFRAAQGATSPRDSWMIWSITAGLVGWNVAMMSVAPLRQVNTFLFVVIGVTQNLERIVGFSPAGERIPARGPRFARAWRARRGVDARPRPGLADRRRRYDHG